MSVMRVVFFVLIFAGIYLALAELRVPAVMRRVLLQKLDEVNAAARERNLADRQNLLLLQDTYSFWYRLEQRLCYSGIKARFPGLTAEWWLVGNILVCAGAVFIVIPFGGILRALLAALLLLAVESRWLIFLSKRNLRRTEENLIRLLDFLGNYSIASGDITGVFSQVSRYMEEPVKSALEACSYETSTTGDASAALLAMAESVEHPKFKELARNMEISSRYCADFTALVASSRRSLREYLRSEQERRGMFREAMINLLLLAGMSIVVLFSVGKLTGTDMRVLLTETWPGRIGLGCLALIAIFFGSRMGKAGSV